MVVSDGNLSSVYAEKRSTALQMMANSFSSFDR